MGSTPEYRDLLAELEFQAVTVVDASTEFQLSMEKFRAFSNRETFVNATWQEFFRDRTNENRFALIIGHLVIGNVEYSARPQLGEALAAALRPDGILCEYTLHHRGRLFERDAIIEQFGTLPLNLETLNAFNCKAIFSAREIAGRNAVRPVEIVAPYLTSANPRVRWLAGSLEQITPLGGVWYYGRPWNLERQWRARCFDLMEDFLDTASHYVGNASSQVYRTRT